MFFSVFLKLIFDLIQSYTIILAARSYCPVSGNWSIAFFSPLHQSCHSCDESVLSDFNSSLTHVLVKLLLVQPTTIGSIPSPRAD